MSVAPFGIDATVPVDARAAKAAGAVFVARYLDAGYRSAVKVWLSRPEVDAYHAAGLAVLPISEIGERDVDAGTAAATDRAHRHLAELPALGLDGAAVWWTIDRDTTVADKPTVLAYARAWAAVFPPGRRAVYADADAIGWLHDAGLAQWYWQAAAASWSGWTVHTAAQIAQLAETVTIGRVECDKNAIRRQPFGEFGRQAVTLPSPEETDEVSRRWDTGAATEREALADEPGADARLKRVEKWCQAIGAQLRVPDPNAGAGGSGAPA